MKEMKRILSLLLVVAMLATLCCTVLAGCDGGDDGKSTEAPTGATTEQPTEQPTTDGNTSTKKAYTVNVRSEGGMPLEGITVEVYDGETLLGYKRTGADGKATLELKHKNGYIAKLPADELPAGYTAREAGYTFSGTNANVTITSSVVVGETAPDSYELGDVMYDFTVKTYNDQKSITLSELLKEKKMVLINYWYDGCTYCLQEFPEMDEVYREYKDSIEIVAISPVDRDKDIANFMETYKDQLPEGGLTFPVAFDSEGIVARFDPQGAPTSIIVDRYGVVCLVVEGAMNGYQFRTIFDNFTSDNYEQRLITDPSELSPRQEPNVDMPSSDEIAAAITDKSNITAVFAPETESSDAKFSWPFILAEKDGKTTIKASNSKIPNSFATLYVDIEMKAGQALAFDYLSCTESGEDVVHVLMDRKSIYQISGNGGEWETCYPYVALEDGTYELCLIYVKSNTEDTGDDTIYVDNLRLVDKSTIDVETYIYRDAATDFKEDGSGYNDYITPVFNEADGYYHVNSVDGPILLANLMGSTQFSSQTSVWTFAYNGKVVVDGIDYVNELERYSNYSLNGDIYGYCSVTEELRGLLEKVAAAVGVEKGNENEWLQMCAYYDAYGTDGKQLADPVKGLAIFSAFEATMDKPNEVTYTKIIMPRGLLYRFVPTTAGVYRITSNSTKDGLVSGEAHDVEGWIFDKDQNIIYTYEHNEKNWEDYDNVSMIMYLEAGEEYYIDIAYYDLYAVGTFTFDIEYEGETLDVFTLASPGYFLMGGEGDNVDSGEIVAGGVGVIFNKETGVYHVKNADGTIGPKLYADFRVTTGLFNVSILESIENGGFEFEKSWLDMDIEAGFENIILENPELEGKKLTEDDYKDYFINLWGEYKYEERRDQIANVSNGIYDSSTDCTEIMREYASKIFKAGDTVGGEVIGDELVGCIEVNEELAGILQQYMDTFLFDGVENSWTKLCFYYKHYGSTTVTE